MSLPWNKIKELREQRTKLVEEGNTLLKTAKDEERDLSGEEESRFDQIHAEADKLGKQIEREEQQFYAEKRLGSETRNQPDDEPAGGGEPDGGEQRSKVRDRYEQVAEEVRSAAFGDYLRRGRVDVQRLSEELRSEFGDEVVDELRALETSTDASGGYGVPQTTHNNYVQQLKEINALQRAGATVLTVDANGAYNVPLIDDSSNTGDMSSENAADGNADPTFGVADLTDYRFDADNIPVSNQMLRSSVSNIETILLSLMSTRIGQKQQSMFTTGSGSGQPQGVVSGATVGKTAAATGTITYGELVDLQHAIIQVYRNMSSCGWMMADEILAVVRKITDNDGRPIFQTSTVMGTPDMLLGKPVYANGSMVTSLSADAKPVAFGAFERYWVKQVGRVRIIRDPYTQSGKDQTVFHAFHDAGGAIVDTTAIKTLQMAAS